MVRRYQKLIVLSFALGFALIGSFGTWAQEKSRTAESVWGPNFRVSHRVEVQQRFPFRHGSSSLRRLKHWNEIAINASGLDHTPLVSGDNRTTFAEQLGPGRSSRAMAIVHIAVFDAVNAIVGGYESYTGIRRVRENTSIDSAMAQAAHDTLCAMFPAQIPDMDQRLAEDLDDIPGGRAKTNGIELGQRVAARILEMRTNDGSQIPEPRVGIDWITSNAPGHWRQDPISLIPLALGAHWGEVTPFVLRRSDQFRVPVPPALTSNRYTRAFNEVKRLGGDGVVTPTDRTDEQTTIGIYWAYDGTPSLCAPPRLYNQIAMTIAELKHTDDVLQLARLLALVNTAMADAGIAIWESKYFYDFWRPITGIRESDLGTGPTGAGDGNPNTVGDLTFKPLGAPASNTAASPDFTPPFPAYPSGHAGFGGALFQVLRRFYHTDRIRFSFISDEFNGVTEDRNGNVRPLVERSFNSLSQAEEENGQSRIYLGIHWNFDKTEGIAQGNRVADFVFDHAFERENGHH
jgi:hypothetical protein